MALYKSVTLHLPIPIWNKVSRLAISEETTIINIVSEALLSYVKWIRKTEMQERQEEELAKTREELAEAQAELDALLLERKIAKRRRGRHKRAKVKGYVPDPPVPDNKLGTAITN